MRRVANIGECRGGYSGTIIDASMLTVANHILALLWHARVGSPDPWPVRRI
jgi:hypothetical protein